MFERTREDLLARLGILAPRFGQIGTRALQHQETARTAIKLGLGGSSALYDEIADKAFEQASVCHDAIIALGVRRAWPLMFKRGVRRAEAFAATCEALLNEADAGEAAGHAAFREKYGDVDAQN